MQVGRRFLIAGCDSDGRVRLWLGDEDGGNLAALTSETWPAVTKDFGYATGGLVKVAIEVNREPASQPSDGEVCCKELSFRPLMDEERRNYPAVGGDDDGDGETKTGG